jgi:hypothetical protein
VGRIAVLGEPPRVDGWALAGALVVTTTGADDVRHGWSALPDDVEIVVLTPAAAEALGERVGERLAVVLP